MCGQHEVSTRETCGSGYGASMSEVQNKQDSNFKNYVPCTFIKVLSTSWFNTIHLHIHSSYTCTVKLRQHHRPKTTAVTSCVSCHAYITIFHVPPSAQSCLCHTSHVCTEQLCIARGKQNIAICTWHNRQQAIVFFWSVMLSSLMVVVSATKTCQNLA